MKRIDSETTGDGQSLDPRLEIEQEKKAARKLRQKNCVRLGTVRKIAQDNFSTSCDPKQWSHVLDALLNATRELHKPDQVEARVWAWCAEHLAWATKEAISDQWGLVRDEPPMRASDYGVALNLTYDERHSRQAWTIRPYDVSFEEQKERSLQRRREADKAQKAEKRRKAGAKPQAESASRTEPWLAAGFNCRSTWVRHGKPDVRDTRSSASIRSNIPADETASPLASVISEPEIRPKAENQKKKKEGQPSVPRCPGSPITLAEASAVEQEGERHERHERTLAWLRQCVARGRNMKEAGSHVSAV